VSIPASPGDTIFPELKNGIPGQVGVLEHGIRLKPSTMVVAYTTAGITEEVVDADTSTYTGTLVYPSDALPLPAEYEVVWRHLGEVVATEDIVQPAEVPWRPTAQNIASIAAAYTREHVGGYQRLEGDQVQAGRERGEFTADTDPTLTQVEAYIDTACGEIAGRVGTSIPARCYELATTAAKWHAAASVEAKRRPAESEDQGGLYRAFISNYTATLGELVEQARWASLRLT
jgi:hypothetical protein